MTLKVDGLSFSYGSEPIFSNVSFSVKDGEILSMVGPNGVGKSTLLRCLNGLRTPSSGIVSLSGRDIRGLGRRALSRSIGYVPQHDDTTFGFSVLEMVVMGRAAHIGPFAIPGSGDIRRAEQAVRAVGLEDVAHKSFNELSGGQAQLTVIARALVAEPGLIMLDEPTSHLDISNQARVLRVLNDLSRGQGLAVVMTTHSPDHALLFSDKVLMMRKGSSPLFGKPARIMTPESVGDIYGVDVQLVNIDSRNPEACTVVPDWFGAVGAKRLHKERT